jgi:UrcA family protein
MTRPLILAALAVVLCTASAEAAPAPQLRVALGDVDLASASGRTAALGRIQEAAETVCGPVQYSFDLRGSEIIAARYAHSRCVRRAVAGAVSQLETAGYALNGAPATRLAGN